jgi:N-acetylmuramoyl-L-alanine amidase
MIKCILIEAGHGKSAIGTRDVGAVGKGKTERQMVTVIASKVLEILKAKKELKGVLVQGVGIETEASLRGKIKFVNQVVNENKFTPQECFSLSIHMNSAFSSQPRGFEVWYQTVSRPHKLAIAESLVRSWKEYNITPLRPRPLMPTNLNHWGRLYIDDYVCPAVLVETSFISNKEDVAAIEQDYNRVAESLAHGLLEFIRQL